MSRFFLAALAALAAVVAYGTLIEPRLLLDDRAFAAELPALPPGWDGQRIALIADFQTGMWFDNPSMVEDAVGDILDDSVAAVLIAGDFVYAPDAAKISEAVGLVRPLTEAGVPVVAVLGNHDFSMMKKHSEVRPDLAEQLRAELEAAGVIVLENDATPLVAGGDTLYVAGVGSVWAGRADVDATLAAVPEGAPRVWLMHNSEAFRDIPGEAAHLALAGHTHGGQVRLMPGPSTSWLDVVQEGEVAADGWAADSIGAPPNRIYINRGIGFSTVPVRINCRPELTMITLRVPDGPVPSRGKGEVDILDS